MKICFVAHSVYPFFFSGTKKGQIGGAELQQKLIGEALAARGINVSYISHDVGPPDSTEKNGLTFVKSFNPNAGFPGLRFFYPRLTEIWKALKKADAEVYYVRGAGFLPSVLAVFCRLRNKRFVFAAASDSDFNPGDEMIRLGRDRWLFRMGIRHASRIIVQSECQREMLLKYYGLNSTVIRNYSKIPSPQVCETKRDLILWVSTIRSLKRPFKFVELSEQFPGEHFVMIGGSGSSESDLYERVRERCASVSNLDFLGFLPYKDTERFFDRCKVLVNTSEFEGFPNTFLQAWSRGIPVISYIDPDGIIGKYGLGYSVENEHQMMDALANLMASSPNEYHNRIIEYFGANHSDRIIDEYCSILGELSAS